MQYIIFWVLILGNTLKEYDVALYGFLAYKFSLQFFSNEISWASLIKAYTVLMTAIIVKPLGVIIFNKVASHKTPLYSLHISLLGLGISTICMGCIPTYTQIGLLAPTLLILTRMIQGIFAAGEATIASMYLIALDTNHNKGKSSGYYNISQVLGIMLASLGTNYFNSSESQWRVLYFIGGTTAILGAITRYFIVQIYKNNTNYFNIEQNFCHYKSLKIVFQELANNKLLLLKSVAIGNLSQLTYYLTFVCIDVMAAQLTGLNHAKLQSSSTKLLFCDILLLFGFVQLAKYINYQYIMLVCSFVITIIVPIIFTHIPTFDPTQILMYKTLIMVSGVGFCTFINLSIFQNTQNKNYYWFFGVGYTISGALIGNPLCVVILSLYAITKSLTASAIWIFIIGLCAFVSVLTNIKFNKTTLIK